MEAIADRLKTTDLFFLTASSYVFFCEIEMKEIYTHAIKRGIKEKMAAFVPERKRSNNEIRRTVSQKFLSGCIISRYRCAVGVSLK